MKFLLRICGLGILILICLELVLQVYNPFIPSENSGEHSLNPGRSYNIDIPPCDGMETHIVHNKNSLGFRGPEPSEHANPKIFAVGGSSTECFYLSDGQDWPSALAQKLNKKMPELWMNNAGISANGTAQHIRLLEKHLLKQKPAYILFMCGLEDMGPDTLITGGSFLKTSWENAEIGKTLNHWFGHHSGGAAPFKALNLGKSGFKTFPETSDSALLERLKKEQTYLGVFRKNILELSSICHNNGIKPIFITQSILFSDETDLYTNTPLGALDAGGSSGRTKALLLKMYNKVTHDICREKEIPFINLSARLPKDSRFYYDGYHFTAEGAELAASMIFEEINSSGLIKPVKP